ncbi:MAG TPA: hypothetical protein VEZ90_07740 [Blastocatellia bacterium]|nr:hypothetical protein [Blastocatellia bacterium]
MFTIYVLGEFQDSMGDDRDEESLIRRYLLSDLPEEESEKVELRIMSDREYSGLVDILESELIDDYADDALSPADRERFERLFLTVPERQEHVAFAIALRKYVDEHAGSKSKKESEDQD